VNYYLNLSSDTNNSALPVNIWLAGMLITLVAFLLYVLVIYYVKHIMKEP
jgi:hypothetical protein